VALSEVDHLRLVGMQLTVPIAGIYEVTGGVNWSGIVNAGVRQLDIYVNGDPGVGKRVAAAVEPGSANGQNYMEVTTLTKLGASDTVELSGRQTSGSAMTIYSNAEYADNEMPRLEISWVASALGSICTRLRRRSVGTSDRSASMGRSIRSHQGR
jgi:hypothetical protein